MKFVDDDDNNNNNDDDDDDDDPWTRKSPFNSGSHPKSGFTLAEFCALQCSWFSKK